MKKTNVGPSGLSANKAQPNGNLDNKISATPAAKKKQPAIDKSMFSQDALGSSIAATKGYGTKTKGTVDKSVFCLGNDTNSIFPDNKAC